MDKGEISEILKKAIAYAAEGLGEGKPANYIPELAQADPKALGIAMMDEKGYLHLEGETDKRFTIQSISKVISLSVALETQGFDAVFSRMKMEPTGDAFNSIIKLDMSGGKPFNPLVNSGAIAVISVLQPSFDYSDLMEWSKKLCMDDGICLDRKVYECEKATGARNTSIAYLLKSSGALMGEVEPTLDLYFRMCSLSVNTKSLAGFGLILANNGRNPFTGEQILSPEVVKVTKTIMFTCGMYDESGEYAVRVGIPSKSGVGGGILATVEGRLGIGTYGPALDEKGNSIGGSRMLEYLSREMHLHVFDSFPLV